MSYTRRDYRTHLSADALIFIDGKELPCTVVDTSTSGAKLEINPGHYSKSIRILSEIINIGDIVDFYIQEMHFDGEVEIVRKEIIGKKLYLSIIYSDIFYGLEHLPYRRKHYRTRCRSAGSIMIDKTAYEVLSHNISLGGMKIAVFDPIQIEVNSNLALVVKQLNVQATAQLVWQRQEQDYSLMGLKYTQLKEPINRIPSFP